MDNLLRYIQLRAFGRGLRGYHTAWFVVGVAAWMLLKALRHDDVIFRTRLKTGERLVISASSGSSAPPVP
jgi:hypothetical protein